jgi:hypothetical protein
MLHKINLYIQKYPARVAGYMSAITLNASKYWSNLPLGLIVPIAMLLIMMGEGSQRLEDKKTLEALYTENDPHKPDEEILTEMIEHLETAKRGKKNGRAKRSS